MEDTSAEASVGICTRYLHELQARSANQFRSGSVCSLVHCRLLIRGLRCIRGCLFSHVRDMTSSQPDPHRRISIMTDVSLGAPVWH